MPHTVTVTTGSRLHFGPFSCGETTGRHFGGVGVMLDSPGFHITAERSSHEAVLAPQQWRPAILQTLQSWRRNRGGEDACEAVRLEIHAAIPRHRGLGSGTQLALAVGTALEWITTGEGPDVLPLASAVHRGRRSAIGIHGFQQGGFLIDAGKRADDEIGALAARVEFPPAWRFVLAMPKEGRGLSGETEEAALRTLPPMPASLSGTLCRLALTELLPAVRNAEFAAFSQSLFEYGQRVGDYFSPAQGGRFAHREGEDLLRELQQQGLRGVVQSSWGPILAATLPGQREAETLVSQLREAVRWSSWSFHITAACNHGAQVRASGRSPFAGES